MSVTAPLGFRAAGVAAGLKPSGARDVAVVVNDGPSRAAAGVFTANRVKAAPVLWTQQVIRGGRVRAVLLNSGGANACTGPSGFADTHRTAEHLAAALADSRGRDGGLLDRADRRAPADGPAAGRGGRGGRRGLPRRRPGGRRRHPDHRHRRQDRRPARRRLHGRGHGQGRGHARARARHHALRPHHRRRPRRGRRSTRRSAPRHGSRSTGSTPTAACPPTTPCCCWPAVRPASARRPASFTRVLTEVCADLARAVAGRRRGASKAIAIEVVGAASEDDAVVVGRAVARSTCSSAPRRRGPELGQGAGRRRHHRRRVRAGAAQRRHQRGLGLPQRLRRRRQVQGGPAATGRDDHRRPGRRAHAATIRTTDLTAAYVHENSAYST